MKKYLVLLVGSLLVLSSCAGGPPAPVIQKGAPAKSGPQNLAKPDSYTQNSKLNGSGPYAEGGIGHQKDNASKTPPVKVALLLPLSGQGQDIGQAMLKASQMALFDLGAETFQLLPKDTGGTPTGAAQAANEAVREGAQLILGPLFSSSVDAVKPIAQRANLNVVAFSTDWSKAGGNIYLMGFMPFVQVERVTDYAARQGLKNIALIAKMDAYGGAVERSFTNAAGRKGIRISKIVKIGAGGLTPSDLQSLKTANPDAVLIAVGGQEAFDISKRMAEFGMPALTVKRLGTGLWDEASTVNSLYMDRAWFAAPTPRQRRSFEKNYADLYGAAPPRLATLAYDGTALAAVLGKMGKETASGAYVPAYGQAALRNPNGFAGIDGVFRFNSNGLIERQLSVLEIRDRSIVEIDPAATRF